MKMKLEQKMVCPCCNTSFKVSIYDIYIKVKDKNKKPKQELYLGIKKSMTPFIVKCSECGYKIELCGEDLQSKIMDYLYEHTGHSNFIEDFFECYLQ